MQVHFNQDKNQDKESFFKSRRVKLFLLIFVATCTLVLAGALFMPKIRNALHMSASRSMQRTAGAQLNTVTAQEQVFKDVPLDDANASAIAYLKKKGLIKGFKDGSFKPDDPIKREEFIKLVVTAKSIDPHPVSNSYCFKDVAQQWFASYVCYAKNKGWVKGYDDGSFGVGKNITAKEALMIVMKSFGVAIPEKTGLSDVQLTRGGASGIIMLAMASGR